MKKSIKKFLIFTQVLGWGALVASACTDNDLKTSPTTNSSSSDGTNKDKPEVNSSTNPEQDSNTNVNKQGSGVIQESDKADATHTETGKQETVDQPPQAPMGDAEGSKKELMSKPGEGNNENQPEKNMKGGQDQSATSESGEAGNVNGGKKVDGSPDKTRPDSMFDEHQLTPAAPSTPPSPAPAGTSTNQEKVNQ